jgi:thiol-disulfide isomerase/thioredoxin
MILEHAARVVAVALTVVACTQQPPRAEGAASDPNGALARERDLARLQVAERARRLELLLGGGVDEETAARAASFRIVGMDDGPVPDFDLVTPDGVHYSSSELVGKQPFVTVFFATWCDYCAVELQALQRSLAEVGPMPVIPVSADGSETWQQVPAYLAQFGLRQSAVRARDYPLFSVAYDPFDTVPVVVIVGRNGGLVDYHVGYDPAYAERLKASLRLAQSIGPLTQPAERASAAQER